ncbi:MAG: YihY/virulence factor BrkB family protein [Plectolyngbya sp. WJT66-NPBG17]|jgi:membrane protein|nr:YihY/virulence factor BrkB family protein [Plectolyngbya sp. WJT66-NPBG17]MBW4527057.1 YihY/virulence factor BrkB family protein [Phormidium tanganyikae FI6-MK23]
MLKRLSQSGLALLTRFLQFFKHLNLKTLAALIRRAAYHRLPGLSAEIAYNAIFALFPAALAVLSAIGLFEISEANFGTLTNQLGQVIPEQASILTQESLRYLRAKSNQGLFSLSFLASIWISSSVTGATMAALDQIYRIPRDRVRPFWQAKLVALALALGTFLLLVVALLIIFITDIAVQIVAYRSGSFAHSLFYLWQLLSLPIALSIVTLALGFIYRHGTSHWQHGRPIMPGAILAALLWAMLSGLLRFYVSRVGNFNQVYGAIGAVIILLLWLYLSAFSMLLGGLVNSVVGEAMQRKLERKRN